MTEVNEHANLSGQRCEHCGSAGSGQTESGQYCETCGFAAGASGARAGPAANGHLNGYQQAELGSWTAVVSADLVYYEKVISTGGEDAARVPFPGYCTERRFRLTGTEMRIGRRSVSRGLEPEIDLTGPPTDPGVSRLHAVLIAGPDGGWAILDPGSENGTFVNDNEIATGVPVPLADEDRIHLGAWTMILIHAQ